MTETVEVAIEEHQGAAETKSGDGSGKPNGKERAAAKRNYAKAVADGFYQRDSGGLSGKYDNVRRFWEDQITRYVLHDFVAPLVARKRRNLCRIRVLDLGAGAGEGYEILTSLKREGASLASKEVDVLPTEMIGHYKGLDISPAMVEQGNALYANDPKVEFAVADLAHGLVEVAGDSPYDVYFSSFGSLSHLHDEELDRLVKDVIDHCEGSAIFVADLIGRYSFEWQCYWDRPGTDETNMRQYSMSYMYPREMLDRIEVERFPIRYWGADEFDAFMRRIVEERGARIGKQRLWDRSVIVGRHMNTGEYNPHAQPIREAVNSLHEFTRRTNLEDLIFDYAPHGGFAELNEFFESFQMAWNAVVYAALEALERWDDAKYLGQQPPKEYPETVQEAIRTIRHVVRHVKWFRMGDPRATIVEPQLGYILRNLEMDMQQGLGTAHGLVGVYEIVKETNGA